MAPNPVSRATLHVLPYCDGVDTRRDRLVPNVNDAVIAATATTMPIIAVRTGTAVRPRPGSSANRTPLTTLGPSPARLAFAAIREGRLVPRSSTVPSAVPSARAALHPAMQAIAVTISTIAAKP